jgi:hypothetical protein
MGDLRPEALLLADKADKVGDRPIAAELRRQHEEIQSLRDRLAKQRPTLWALKDNPGITTHSRPQAESLWDALGPIV